MLGQYQLDRELGRGTMGVVYLGQDVKTGRVAAIKTISMTEAWEDNRLDEVRKSFFREADTAARLKHPGIVTIFDAGEEHGLAYLAMEYLEGQDLSAYSRRSQLLPLESVLWIVARIADALHYAHGENVVHRDIKPGNIVYQPEAGALKITDFGIAFIVDRNRKGAGLVCGTPAYMSPEQTTHAALDGRSDLFSLGVMLFQLLTGRIPFSGTSLTELIHNVVHQPPPNILLIRPELASRAPILPSIVAKSLEKSLTGRYQSGADLARDLRACLERLQPPIR